MLREIKTIHQLPMYSADLFCSLAQIALTFSPPVPFFRYSRKTLLSRPFPHLKTGQAVQQQFHSGPCGPNEILVVIGSLFVSDSDFK